jgi:hypothetical protein
MKFFFLLFALVVSTTFLANDLHRISLPKNQKVEGTFSADINSNATIHIVLTKEHNENNYQLIPVFIREDNSIKQLETVTIDHLPSILSYHFNDETFIVVGYNAKDKVLSIINLNLVTGKYSMSQKEDVDAPQNVIRLDNKTILIQKDKTNKELVLQEVSSEGQISIQNITILNEDKKKFKLFTHERPEAINSNEYVKNGSISKSKLYYEQGQLFYTLDEEKTATTQIMKIDLDGANEISFQNYPSNEITKLKDYNSYLYKGSLFSIASNKEDIIIKAFDLTKGDQKAYFSLQDNINSLLSDKLITEKYLKSAAKGKMKPTITINATVNNNLVIRLDQVDGTTYNYQYNWWMHHWMWQQQMWHQQMINQQIINSNINSMNRFTPNVDMYDTYYDVFSRSSELTSIEFLVDNTFQLLKNANPETKFNRVDKEKLLEKFEDDKNYLNITAGFTKSSFRYIYQDWKSKDIVIKLEVI